MAKNIFLTFVASLLLCACGSEDIIPNQTLGSTDGPNKYTFNISVEGPEDSQTRAIKQSWTAGDKIFMWFDDNADAANADLVITTADGSNWTTESLRDEVSLKESGVIKALYLSSNSWDGTLPTVVPMVLYTDGTKVTYTCENNVVTANIGNWLYATQFQVVVSGLDDVTTPENYSLTCDKFSSLSSINVATEGISVGTSNQATIGTTNADGIAFYFASLTKGADEEQKYALTLRNEGKWMKNYFFNKTLANENTKCKGLKLNASKLTAGMVQYWSFDGNVNNSITGYHGTYVNAALTTDRHGNENAAYLFSGGQRINIPSAACSFHQSSFTANVWVCTTMKSGLGNLLRCHPGNGNGWLFRYNDGNVEIWEGRSPSCTFISSGQTYADGNWHMLTYVRDTENKKGVLYADGKYVGEYTMGSGPNDYDTDLVIGACYFSGGYVEYFKGKIDDVQLYDGALSAADVHNLYYLQEDHLFNGHSYVDLGLPSGTLWATCNVGADVPEAPGCYYAWGETEDKVLDDIGGIRINLDMLNISLS